MHEATRRLLGVLLRHLDGFETNKRSVVIAATNRKEDLDPALLSRSPLVLPSHLDHCLLLLSCWAAACIQHCSQCILTLSFAVATPVPTCEVSFISKQIYQLSSFD